MDQQFGFSDFCSRSSTYTLKWAVFAFVGYVKKNMEVKVVKFMKERLYFLKAECHAYLCACCSLLTWWELGIAFIYLFIFERLLFCRAQNYENNSYDMILKGSWMRICYVCEGATTQSWASWGELCCTAHAQQGCCHSAVPSCWVSWFVNFWLTSFRWHKLKHTGAYF